MKHEALDIGSILGLASFAGLILTLILSVPFSLDRAQPNQPLTSAVSALMK